MSMEHCEYEACILILYYRMIDITQFYELLTLVVNEYSIVLYSLTVLS